MTPPDQLLAIPAPHIAPPAHEPREVGSPPRIARRPGGGDAPLSFAQERLWFLDRLGQRGAARTVSRVVRFRRGADAAALERALGEVVRRHEALRTRFREVDGLPRQAAAPATRFVLPVEELPSQGGAAPRAEVRRRAAEEAGAPFDLATGPLLRARLLRTPGEDVLLLTAHPIVCDPWSMTAVVGELRRVYAALRAGRTVPAGEPALQYADFAVWQRGRSREAYAAELAYWRERLAGAPAVLELPADRPRPPVQTFRGGRVPLRVPAALAERVRRLARVEGTTPFVVLMAAFKVLLSRYAGSDDVVVGTPVAGRSREELRELVGLFTNDLVLRTDLSGDPPFRDLVGRVGEVVRGAGAHQEVPFERLMEALQPERSLSHAALFQVLFQLDTSREAGPRGSAAGRDEAWGEEVGEAATAGFDLSLSLWAKGGGLAGVLEYSADLFERGTARRMADHFVRVLEQAADEPDLRLSRLRLMGDAHRARVLEWNRTTAHAPEGRCLHHLFEEQAARTPDAVAVLAGGAALTYRELDRASNRVARFLSSLGVGPEVRVGLCLERGPEVMPAILGVLKAGGAYVPLEPGHPAERIGYMLRDAGVRLLLTQERLLGRVPALEATRVVCLDGERAAIDAQADGPVASDVASENLAYVIYTSGSTGRPKGVAMHHRGVVNYVHWGVRAYGADRGNGAPVFSSLAVDLTLTSFLPLFAGRPLHFLPQEHPVEALAQALRAKPGYGVVKITPTHLALLNEMLSPEELEGVAETLVVGADFLNAEPTVVWQEHAPGVRLMNEYGPTETVVGCSAYVLPGGAHRAGPVPVGRPIQNLSFYLLDARLEPVPIGLPGELFIGGEGVARGYLGRPGLTAATFLPDPFAGGGARMYRSGDRARWLGDGNLTILGRVDRQVKVRGYRVELGEVEAAVRAHPEVAACLAVLRPGAAGPPRLVAYVVGDPGADALREHLRARVPEHMVPDAFVRMESLPKTASGKVDPRALPAPAPEEGEAEAPASELEAELAGIWEELLAVQGVSPTRSFFELGGNSFLALQLLARVNRRFGCRVHIAAFFTGATVREMAEEILRQREAETAVRSAGADASRAAAGRDLSFERAIRFASELIRIPSLSGEEGPVARRIVQELRELGYDEARTDRAGNVIGRIAGRGEAPAVMLSSHMDVVDVGDPTAWEFDPYGGTVSGGYLHGRGAMDLKGPLALQVYAAARFVESRPPGDILVVCSVHEERGGWGMMQLMATAGLRPGAVILAEATDGDLCTGHRGHAELAVEIHGVAAHASAPERGRSPHGVLPAVLAALDEISAVQVRDAVLGQATFTPTMVESWPRSGNVIPDRVRVTLDLRVLPGWDEAAALEEIRARLAERIPPAPGVRVEVLPGRATFRAWTGWASEDSNFTPGFLLPGDHPVVRAAAGAICAGTGIPPIIRPWKFGTDGGHTCGTHGIPTIGFAPGEEALAHTTRERLSLESARGVFDVYPSLIRSVQDALVATPPLDR